MKKILAFLALSLMAPAAFAQSTEEIFSRMDEAMEKHVDDGVYMIVDLKIPIVGTTSTETWARGDRFKMSANMLGIDVITWGDGGITRVYNSKTNEIIITDAVASDEPEGDIEMFEDMLDGYDAVLDRETDKAWYFILDKSRDNKEKDAPKRIDVAIAKGTYHPLSLSTRMNGITLRMHDISYGVTEKQVAFNPADYPDATVVDKRK